MVVFILTIVVLFCAFAYALKVNQISLFEKMSEQQNIKDFEINKAIGNVMRYVCQLSDVWVDCNVFIDQNNIIREVIAIPKSDNEKRGTWDQAMAICKSHNSALISIESEKKQKLIESVINSSYWYWTSGWRNSDSKWIWNSNGNEFTFTNWKTIESPHDEYNECLSIYRNASFNYVWSDTSCLYHCLVLCEFNI